MLRKVVVLKIVKYQGVANFDVSLLETVQGYHAN